MKRWLLILLLLVSACNEEKIIYCEGNGCKKYRATEPEQGERPLQEYMRPAKHKTLKANVKPRKDSIVNSLLLPVVVERVYCRRVGKNSEMCSGDDTSAKEIAAQAASFLAENSGISVGD